MPVSDPSESGLDFTLCLCTVWTSQLLRNQSTGFVFVLGVGFFCFVFFLFFVFFAATAISHMCVTKDKINYDDLTQTLPPCWNNNSKSLHADENGLVALTLRQKDNTFSTEESV